MFVQPHKRKHAKAFPPAGKTQNVPLLEQYVPPLALALFLQLSLQCCDPLNSSTVYSDENSTKGGGVSLNPAHIHSGYRPCLFACFCAKQI